MSRQMDMLGGLGIEAVEEPEEVAEEEECPAAKAGAASEEAGNVDRLHRIHASPASGKGGCSLDVGGNSGVRWRGEGGLPGGQAYKRAMAYRLAFCWNAMEGWPIEVMDQGIVRKADEMAHELARACAADEGFDREQLREMGKALSELLEMRDRHFDDC